MTERSIADARSFLFVPGDRPERFDKALAAGADAVIVDLEDAVAPAAKAAARLLVAEWLKDARPVILRINAADSEWFEADLALCRHPGVAAILLPKAQAGRMLVRVAALRPTIALVESAQGILDMPAIAQTDGVERLAFGAIDLALDLDTQCGDADFAPFRLQMVVAARAAGLAGPIDGVTVDFRDPAAVTADARAARALGFTGKLCIHPAQIAPLHAALRPTEAALALAEAIVAADAQSGGAAVSLDGQMVDRPVVERALRLLSRR
uniref:HpcH/HpaI aldolase/citrate lyase family protein n=1 Tax=uncultured Sphingomonas sp. TaxID=158754 RepID=UPI0035CA496C